jgi:hypothetical protein
LENFSITLLGVATKVGIPVRQVARGGARVDFAKWDLRRSPQMHQNIQHLKGQAEEPKSIVYCLSLLFFWDLLLDKTFVDFFNLDDPNFCAPNPRVFKKLTGFIRLCYSSLAPVINSGQKGS